MTSSREQALSIILQDLDRCEHGRHRGDVCSGYSILKPHAGCNGGISLGNPFFAPGRPIGYNRSGEPYIFPVDPYTTGEPKAWTPGKNGALDVYLEMRYQVEPVLLPPTEENLADSTSSDEDIRAIVDTYGWAIAPSQTLADSSYAITIGMSGRGLPELALYDVGNVHTAAVILNAVACSHAQTVEGLTEGAIVRVGPSLVTVLGPDPVYGHRWHTALGRLYGEDVPVVGVIA